MTSHLSPDDQAKLSRVWEHLRAAQALMEELTGDDDPTGLRYSRDDDEPPAASTRPHDGYSLTGRNQRPTNSSAGSAFDTVERRTHQVSGRPGSKQCEARTRGLASPTLRVGVA